MLSGLIIFGVCVLVGLVILQLNGGGIFIRGTKRYERFNREADERVRERLKDGSGSTREELMEWWDKYH